MGRFVAPRALDRRLPSCRRDPDFVGQGHHAPGWKPRRPVAAHTFFHHARCAHPIKHSVEVDHDDAVVGVPTRLGASAVYLHDDSLCARLTSNFGHQGRSDKTGSSDPTMLSLSTIGTCAARMPQLAQLHHAMPQGRRQILAKCPPTSPGWTLRLSELLSALSDADAAGE